jgi:hypothetical protein
MTDAPTPYRIDAERLDVYLHCEQCREMRAAGQAITLAIARGHGAKPVDQLTFRCRCGRRGEPWVYAGGNALNGRGRIWPPV